MNLQDIVDPLAKAMESSFEGLLVPIGDAFNWVVIVGGVVGLFVWLKMQNDYTAKAKKDGTIV